MLHSNFRVHSCGEYIYGLLGYLISSKYFPVSHDGDLSCHANAKIPQLLKVFYSAIVHVNQISFCFSTGTVAKERLNSFFRTSVLYKD